MPEKLSIAIGEQDTSVRNAMRELLNRRDYPVVAEFQTTEQGVHVLGKYKPTSLEKPDVLLIEPYDFRPTDNMWNELMELLKNMGTDVYWHTTLDHLPDYITFNRNHIIRKQEGPRYLLGILNSIRR